MDAGRLEPLWCANLTREMGMPVKDLGKTTANEGGHPCRADGLKPRQAG